MKKIYLDYAAATPLDTEVLKSMQPYLTDKFYNPSATYLGGRNVRHNLENARSDVAAVIGSKPAEVIFTAGATEANNLAIQGVLKHSPAGEIAVSAIEHDSVLAPAKLFKHTIVRASNQGAVSADEIQKKITDKTVLVSIGLVNNELGSIHQLKEVAAIVRQTRKYRNEKNISLPIYLHTDAAQAPCYVDIHVARLGVDMMSLNGGKIFGPKQTGALYVRAGTKIQSLILGGGQESGLRSGTENVANFVGLAAALGIANKLRRKELERISILRQLFLDGLEKIIGAELNSPIKHASPHIVNVRFESTDNERLMMELDERGVQVAVGSACSASSLEPSHVLKAIGLNDDQARSSVRVSFGRQTTENDIKFLLKYLQNRTV